MLKNIVTFAIYCLVVLSRFSKRTSWTQKGKVRFKKDECASFELDQSVHDTNTGLYYLSREFPGRRVKSKLRNRSA